ncbi:MAG: hypothetical protein LIP09_07700 [Bacteroidales bacterium]|nr:hypothetical protein [Bacteroidales bacterium]
MKLYPYLLCAALAATAVACSDSDDNNEPAAEETSAKEVALKSAANDYVNYTVLPTYKAMADAAIEMSDLCEEIQAEFEAGTLSSSHILAAGEAWKKARKNWELSEAFLFGPAANHNIDPHIDSWPLDKNAMDNLLTQIRGGNLWSTENLGYGLLGFHAIEYMLYELSSDGNSSLTHSTNYTAEELEYMVGVANDLRDQCVLLEVCWAGDDNVSSIKLDILDEAELGYGEEYGWELANAGSAGSRFKTFQESAEEIIQGCIDIADEVGNTKIGRPHVGSSEEDKNYIESPYSLNSIEDFVDNIKSIQNSYIGTSGSSISDYIKSVNPDLDTEMRTAITDAINAISAIPEPFAKNATGSVAGNAVTVVGSDLVDVLQKVYNQLGK